LLAREAYLVPNSVWILYNHPLIRSRRTFFHQTLYFRSQIPFEIAYGIQERWFGSWKAAEYTHITAPFVPEWVTASWAAASGLQSFTLQFDTELSAESALLLEKYNPDVSGI